MGCADGARCSLRGRLAEDRQASLCGTSFLLKAASSDEDNPRPEVEFSERFWRFSILGTCLEEKQLMSTFTAGVQYGDWSGAAQSLPTTLTTARESGLKTLPKRTSHAYSLQDSPKWSFRRLSWREVDSHVRAVLQDLSGSNSARASRRIGFLNRQFESDSLPEARAESALFRQKHKRVSRHGQSRTQVHQNKNCEDRSDQ